MDKTVSKDNVVLHHFIFLLINENLFFIRKKL